MTQPSPAHEFPRPKSVTPASTRTGAHQAVTAEVVDGFANIPDGLPTTRPARPSLRPGTELAWLRTGELAVGTRPGLRLRANTATLVTLARLLPTIDGTRAWDDVVVNPITPEILDALVAAGCLIDDHGRGLGVVAGLTSARARVVDADTDDAFAIARRRMHAAVHLSAPPVLLEPIVAGLAASGVQCNGHSRPDIAASVSIAPGSEPRLNCSDLDPWLHAGIPHIGASVSGTRVRVSHVVRPGTTACGRCLVLSEDDRMMTISADRPGGVISVAGMADSSCGADVTALCAGLVIGRLLAHIDGLPDHTTETILIDTAGRVESLLVAPHPNCGCALAALLRTHPA